jgi:hypothetical protein
MKTKSKTELEQRASFIWQDLEKDLKPCEALYVLSEVAKILSLVMLQKEQKEA